MAKPVRFVSYTKIEEDSVDSIRKQNWKHAGDFNKFHFEFVQVQRIVGGNILPYVAVQTAYEQKKTK